MSKKTFSIVTFFIISYINAMAQACCLGTMPHDIQNRIVYFLMPDYESKEEFIKRTASEKKLTAEEMRRFRRHIPASRDIAILTLNSCYSVYNPNKTKLASDPEAMTTETVVITSLLQKYLNNKIVCKKL